MEVRGKLPNSVIGLLYKGFYPPLYDQPFEIDKWFSNYIRTYIERNIRQLKNIGNIVVFERFLRFCAARVGQLLNKNALAVEIGSDNKTVESWIGLLEASCIVYRLRPHHKNFNKRIEKISKLYFYDVGLATALLGIQNAEQRNLHPFKRALPENMVVIDLLKKRFNKGKNDNLYFWRDRTGHEVDSVIDNGLDLVPVEIKAGKTLTSAYTKGIDYWNKIAKTKGGIVVYAVQASQKRSNGTRIIPYTEIRSVIS